MHMIIYIIRLNMVEYTYIARVQLPENTATIN